VTHAEALLTRLTASTFQADLASAKWGTITASTPRWTASPLQRDCESENLDIVFAWLDILIYAFRKSASASAENCCEQVLLGMPCEMLLKMYETGYKADCIIRVGSSDFYFQKVCADMERALNFAA
jgi:hypothetical protein